MSKVTLPVNFQDDILNSSMNGKRRYNIVQNSDGTISLEDVSTYDQVGNNYGAAQINALNKSVNESADSGKIIDDVDAISAVTEGGYIAGALALKQINNSLVADNSQQFQFAYDSESGKYGYKVKEADTDVFVPFSSGDAVIFLITQITVTKYSKDMTAQNTYYINSDYVEIDLTANRINILKDIPNAVVLVKGYWSAVYKNGVIFGTDTTNGSVGYADKFVSADLKAGDYFELYGDDTASLIHPLHIYSGVKIL